MGATYGADMAIDPTPDQVASFVQSAHEGPVQMINLLQFKPDGGRESYGRYAEEVQVHLDAVGARIVAHSSVREVVIGEAERPWWDAILTVEYPSVAKFIEMVTSEGYQAIAGYRTDALTRAELIATAPGTLEA